MKSMNLYILSALLSGIAIGISVATMILSNKHRKTNEMYENFISSQPKYTPIKAIYFNENTQKLMIITDSGAHESIRQIGPEGLYIKK